MTPPKLTGTFCSPGSRLELFSGYVASALTPSGIFAMSAESRMQPLMMMPCSQKGSCIATHNRDFSSQVVSMHNTEAFMSARRHCSFTSRTLLHRRCWHDSSMDSRSSRFCMPSPRCCRLAAHTALRRRHPPPVPAPRPAPPGSAVAQSGNVTYPSCKCG